MDMYFPQSEYEARWSKVEAGLKRRNLDAAVIWGRSAGNFERCADVLYLTNYYGTESGQAYDTATTYARGFAAVLLRPGQTPELMADEPGPNPDLLATDRINWSMNTVQGLADLLTREGVKGRVAFVGADFFPMKYWFTLQKLTPQIEWQIEDDLVREARWIKSPRELDAYREASHTVSKALTILMESLQLGKPEAEAAAAAAHEVIRRGGHIHMMPISHGKLIHYFARDPLNGFSQDAPVNGDLVRGWVYGPMFQGYWMDPGRTAVCGRASNSQKHLIESCAKIVATLIAEIKPGRSMSDLAKLGHQLVAEFGGAKDQAAEQFPLFGHGLGLFFERPEIATDMGCENDVFQEGMVMGVEAFLAMPGVGSAGYEDNIIIGKGGAEVLTTTPSVWS